MHLGAGRMIRRKSGQVALAAAVLLAWVAAAAAAAADVRAYVERVEVSGRRFACQVVRANLDAVHVRVGLAEGRVGRTETLDAIARRYGAAAAINGGYFEAYRKDARKSPNHTLRTGGRWVHKGDVGSLFGVSSGGVPRFERVRLRIEGSLDGRFAWPDNWYAYWLNRWPEGSDAATVFTPEWGDETGIADGIQIVVSGGRVERAGRGSQRIPREGFVLYLRGKERSLADRFRPGRACAYRVVRPDGGAMAFWDSCDEALACGPRLVADGRAVWDPVAEGFRHEKVLKLSGARSAVGVTSAGELLLVTATATVREMSDAMLALGARDAMNLDGGASSGLWYEGRYLTTPGRPISNALVILPQK